jgi:uncharacterized membrane protein
MLALLGAGDSSYALYQHYTPPETSACDVNETISCTAINQSEYSVLLGMPVAGLGTAGYALIAALAVAMMVQFRKMLAGWLLLAVTIVALVFSLWLTWIEIFILKAVCPLCVMSLLAITAITVLALLVVLFSRWEAVDI